MFCTNVHIYGFNHYNFFAICQTGSGCRTGSFRQIDIKMIHTTLWTTGYNEVYNLFHSNHYFRINLNFRTMVLVSNLFSIIMSSFTTYMLCCSEFLWLYFPLITWYLGCVCECVCEHLYVCMRVSVNVSLCMCVYV